MRKMLFIRLFAAVLLVTLTSLVLLGALYLRMTHGLLRQRRVADLSAQATTLSGLVKDLAERADGRSSWIDENFLLQLYYIARQSNAEIWVYYEGVAPLQSYDRSQDWIAESIERREGVNVFEDPRAVEWVYNVRSSRQEVVHEGDMDGLFSIQVVSFGLPIFKDDRIAGVIAIHTREDSVARLYSSLSSEVFNAFLIAALLSLVLTSLVAASVTRPLSKMSAIVSEFAQGRFDKRVDIRGRDEIAALGQNLNRMADDLGNLETLRQGFVANVSHELRTPMTSMRGFVQAMLDGTIPAHDEPKYLAIVRDETERLSKLVNDLLDLSRIESGALPIKPVRFEINECLRRALIRFENAINAKKLDVRVTFREDPCHCVADIDRIEQVVINLLDNAIKFTPEGGVIEILTYATKDKAFISISDNGPGISQDDVRFIWERFYKSDKSHSSPGTGLGLSIVKRILDAHGQQIQALPRAVGGVTFQFTLKKG